MRRIAIAVYFELNILFTEDTSDGIIINPENTFKKPQRAQR